MLSNFQKTFKPTEADSKGADMIKKEKICPICKATFEAELIKEARDERRCKKEYEQGRADAKKEINEIMDMDVSISNILYEIDKWLKEQI